MSTQPYKAQILPNGAVGVWLPPWAKAVREAIKERIPGRIYDGKLKRWEIPPTPAAVGVLAAAAPDIAMSPMVAELAESAAAQVRRWGWFSETDPAVQDDLAALPIEAWIKTTPWEHQRRGMCWTSDGAVSLVGAKMGAGKTLVTIAALNRRAAKRVLVVCPAAVTDVWPRELRRHSAVDWHVENGNVYTRNGTVNKAASTVAKRFERVLDVLETCPCGRPHMGVLNYECLPAPAMDGWLPLHRTKRDRLLDAVIYDEAHKLKAPGGAASKVAAKWLPYVPWRIGLTGTPIPQGLEDIYGEFRALDPAIFGTSMAAYRTRHLIMGGYEETQVVGVRDPEDLARRFHSITWIPKVKLDVPAMLPHVVVEFDLEPKAMAAYRTLERTSYLDLSEFVGRDAELDAKNPPVTLLREQQLTGGWLPEDVIDGDGEQIRVSTAKEAALLEVLEGLDEPVVVVCRFKTDLAVVRSVTEGLGRRYAEISGRTKDGLNRDAMMREDVDVVGVQIQSGGAGIDLTRSRVMVWYSPDYALSNFDQMRAREQRPGQLRRVVNVFLIARSTVDAQIFAALDARRDALAWVFDERMTDRDPSAAPTVPDPLDNVADAGGENAFAVDLAHLERWLVGAEPASVATGKPLAVTRASQRVKESAQEALMLPLLEEAGIADF